MLAMDSVVEDTLTLIRHSDNQTLIMEEPIIMTSIEEDPNIILGSLVQTRDYYLDSSSSVRRKLSLEWSVLSAKWQLRLPAGSFKLAYREVVALADDRGLWKELSPRKISISVLSGRENHPKIRSFALQISLEQEIC
ncbi:hypothetical protein AAC387_Pa04g1091 [Persea americana]